MSDRDAGCRAESTSFGRVAAIEAMVCLILFLLNGTKGFGLPSWYVGAAVVAGGAIGMYHAQADATMDRDFLSCTLAGVAGGVIVSMGMVMTIFARLIG